MSEDQRLSTLAVFFNLNDEDNDGEFLSKIGFGSGLIQHLEENNIFQVSQKIDLTEIISPDSDYIIYLGTETSPPCLQTIWIINFDTMDISER
jgi:carbonic anhydrase